MIIMFTFTFYNKLNSLSRVRMEEIDIKWANAAHLGHMKQQIALSKEDFLRISEFLLIKNEKTYNANLEKLKKHFLSIPNSKLFMDSLQPIDKTINLGWQRYFSIDKTPHNHLLHASYKRIPPDYMYLFGDNQIDLPMPKIFYRGQNILGSNVNFLIGKLDKIYVIIQPFGYEFKDILDEDNIKFLLLSISNPYYVKLSHPESKYKGLPTPIYKDGKLIPMMNDVEYMIEYKKYIAKRKKQFS